MTEIQNTTAAMQDPASGENLLFLASAMLDGSPDGFIEQQERAGQRQLVRSQMLPTRVLDEVADADFEALGFEFGEPVPADPMFRPATLPEGWSKRGSDHDMWSYVVDGLGRDRVAVFYKAAFYDRLAHMQLESVDGYLRGCHTHGRVVVADDSWATPAAIAAAARARVENAAERIEFWRGRSEESFAAGYVADYENEHAWYSALAEHFGGQDA